MKSIKAVAIYIKDSDSAATQLKELTDHCSRFGWQVSKVYTGYSGKLNKKTRASLLRDAQTGVIQALAVHKFSSIFESVGDAVVLLSKLNQLNIEFLSLIDGVRIDLQSIGIVTALKNLQADHVRGRIKRGVLLARLQGSSVGRPKIITPELKLEVLALRAQGLSIRAIEKRLDRKLSKSAISRLCSKMGDKP